MSIRIAFIGAGRMATAIVRRLLKHGHYNAKEIACTCGRGNSGKKLAELTGIDYRTNIVPAILEANTLVLACKPQQLSTLDSSIVSAAQGKLVLSILAGTQLSQLNAQFNTARNIVRAMPNTPSQIGAGVTAYATQLPLSPEDQEIVATILEPLGKSYEFEEHDIDAFTALCGSGPAYVFEFAAALRDAAINCGLDAHLSESLAIDTLLGSAKLLAESKDTPEALRDAVTSPGGTTAAALEILENNHFRKLIQQTLAAAKKRSLELSELKSQSSRAATNIEP